MKWLVQRRILCSFLSVFHILIINPWLVIFKCVSSAKLSVLTSSSLAVLQILPVSHLFLPFIQSRGTATLALLHQSLSPSPSLHLISFLFLSSYFTLLSEDGAWRWLVLPFYLPGDICFMQTSRNSRASVCSMEIENKVSFSDRTHRILTFLLF